jgi:hypothetical protein
MDTTLYPLSLGGGKLPQGTRACERVTPHDASRKERAVIAPRLPGLCSKGVQSAQARDGAIVTLADDRVFPMSRGEVPSSDPSPCRTYNCTLGY